MLPYDAAAHSDDVPYQPDGPQPGPAGKPMPYVPPREDSENLAGGGRAVDSYADRDQLPEAYRVEGITRVYVRDDQSTWTLRGGITNFDWVPDGGGGGGALPSTILGGTAAWKGPRTVKFS